MAEGIRGAYIFPRKSLNQHEWPEPERARPMARNSHNPDTVSPEPRIDDKMAVPAAGLPKRGEVFDGKYRVEGVLGVGGMGVVFAARHLRLDERVAIKILLPQWSSDPAIVARFMQEGRSSLKVRSEHVVRVLDDGVIDGRPYLVLEYLDGQDFETLVATEGPMPIATAVTLLLQACEALAEAHVAGIIHRDLKPANLFLTHRADGSPCVKVLDFGISKVVLTASRLSGTRLSGIQAQGTLPTMVMGSPHYMSPEQMQSPGDVDERSDIWSLGAVIHELLSGSPPFTARNITELYARILRDPAPPLALARADIPPALEAVVLRCLEKDPTKRFANVAVLARALAMFGTADAQASADRISRIVEGGIGPAASGPARRDAVSADAARAESGLKSDPPVRAVQRLNSQPQVPLRRPIFGYVALGIIVAAVGGGIGWKVVTQTQANARAAVERPEPASPPAPAPQIPPVPSAVPTSVASTTGAVVARPASSSSSPAGRPGTPQDNLQTALEAKPAAPARPAHRARHTKPAGLPKFAAHQTDSNNSPSANDNPYAAPAIPEPVAPTQSQAAPTASPQPAPADPSQLFDDRK